MRTQYKIETVDGILGPKNVSREFYSSKDFMDVYNIGLNKAVEKLQSDVEKLKDKQRQFANGSQ